MIHVSEIPKWYIEIMKIICTFEKEFFFSTFMDIQVHVLIHLVDDIEIIDVISARSMFLWTYFKKY